MLSVPTRGDVCVVCPQGWMSVLSVPTRVDVCVECAHKGGCLC